MATEIRVPRQREKEVQIPTGGALSARPSFKTVITAQLPGMRRQPENTNTDGLNALVEQVRSFQLYKDVKEVSMQQLLAQAGCGAQLFLPELAAAVATALSQAHSMLPVFHE